MKQRRQFDLLIIGADAPGLAAAACAARQHQDIALRVAVIRTGEEAPLGRSFPGVPDFVWRRLDLHESALEAKPVEALVSLFDGGKSIATFASRRRTERALEEAGADQHHLWPEFAEARARDRDATTQLCHDAAKGKPLLLSELAGKGAAKLGKRLSVSCEDLLDDAFESTELRAHLASVALMPLGLAGDEPGSGLALAAAAEPAAWRVIAGGKNKGLMKALEDACAAAGVEVIESPVRDIQVPDERRRLVVLENGETLAAPAVMVARAASPTAARFGAAPALSPLARREGANAEVRVKLSKPPAPPEGRENAVFFSGGGVQSLKTARDAALEGRIPEDPPIFFEFGKDEIFVTAPYCPAALYTEDERRDWSEQDRQALGRRIVERLGAALNGQVQNVRRVEVKVAAREPIAGAVGVGPPRLLAPPANHDEIGAAARLAMELIRGE